MKLERLPQWEDLLQQALQARLQQTFVRGQSDCVLVIADIIQEFLERRVDIAEKYRGKYHSDLEAMRYLKEECGGDMLAEFRRNMQRYESNEISPSFAQRGDLGYIDLGDDLHRGACLFTGQGVASPAPVGFTFLPRSQVAAAWRIG